MDLLGNKLREAREAKGFSVKEVAEATRIKSQIIENLEDDDFSRIAAPIYGKGFIKLYAEHLGLDSGPLIASYLEATSGGSLGGKPRRKPVAADTRPDGDQAPSRWGGMRKAPDRPTASEELEANAPAEKVAEQSVEIKEPHTPSGELDLGLADTAPEADTRRLFADFNAEEESPVDSLPPSMDVASEMDTETVVESTSFTDSLPELEPSPDEDWSAALEKELQAVGPVSLPMDEEPGRPDSVTPERPERETGPFFLKRLVSALAPRNANEDPVKYAGMLAAVILIAIFLISGVSRILRPGQPGGDGGPVTPELKLAIEAPSPYLGEEPAE